MKITPKNFINRIKHIHGSGEYDTTTRSFISVGLGSVFVALAIAVYYLIRGGESIFLTGLVLLASGIALLVFMIIGVATLKMKLAAVLSCVWITFILFPSVHFLGHGGLSTGSSIWFLMGFAYAATVLAGKPRIVMFFIQIIVYSACFLTALLQLDMDAPADESFYFMLGVDRLISVTVVGAAVAFMFFFRERVMRSEQEVSREQRDEIERLIKSQQGFFSSMSRKIRTPIGGITGLTEMILRSDNLTEEISENTRNIVSSSDMLLTIVEDLIDMNKMQIGDISIENLEYDSALLFTEVMSMLEPKARGKGLELTMDIAPDFPASLFGDKIRMKQVLVNILNNAIKYTRKGSVRFSVKAEPVGGVLVKTIYRVEDTGIGIKPENIDSLFSDFSRVDLGANRKIEGTGLGLSIVKGIVTAMGGQITVESTYGEGSVFTVSLPQNKSGEDVIGDISNYKAKGEVKEKGRFRAVGGRILIVDDDRMSREVVKKLLLNTEAAIDLCESGREALSLTSENAYNIIFMDHVMPQMDGIETFHRIRAQANGKNRMTPIVALTANAGENLKEVYQNIGFAGYLSKPVDISLLEEYVIKSMPEDILEFNNAGQEEAGTVISGLKKKVPVLVTTDSMAGISQDDLTRLGIEILPYCISMPDGSAFIEGKELDIDSMRAVQSSVGISAEVVNAELAEDFFREQLKKAENIIHICIMTMDVSKNYDRLCRVADKVGHVTVFESGTVSVGAGLMTVFAAKMASEGYQMHHIINALIDLRRRVEFRSRIGEVELLSNHGRFPSTLGRILSGLKVDPLLKTEGSRLKLYGFIRSKSSMEDFVDMIYRESEKYEDEIYIAHPDLRNHLDEISRIKTLIKKRNEACNVVTVQSSPIMVANSGMNSLAVALVRKQDE